MSDRKLSDRKPGNDQIGDVELAAVVGGRTEVTKAQYEQILADRQKTWWQKLFA
jgi:hypothetical protein